MAVSLATTLQSAQIVDAAARGSHLRADLRARACSRCRSSCSSSASPSSTGSSRTPRSAFAARPPSGGAVAAILFSAARTLYVEFQVGAATYQAVFGALSAVPLILVWLYACWAVLLLGCGGRLRRSRTSSFARREMRAGEAVDRRAGSVVALEIDRGGIARAFRTGRAIPLTAVQPRGSPRRADPAACVVSLGVLEQGGVLRCGAGSARRRRRPRASCRPHRWPELTVGDRCCARPAARPRRRRTAKAHSLRDPTVAGALRSRSKAAWSGDGGRDDPRGAGGCRATALRDARGLISGLAGATLTL